MTDLNDRTGERTRTRAARGVESCGNRGPNSHPCPVVAIGASAGGLEAFRELFRRMPADTGFAFVLIQHLSPRHETLIPELLAAADADAGADGRGRDGGRAEPDLRHAAARHADGRRCVLYLSKPARVARGRRSPIDRFFRSLAEDQEDEAVAIVLSGTGTDGALGLKAVKERGGLTLVQAPETARLRQHAPRRRAHRRGRLTSLPSSDAGPAGRAPEAAARSAGGSPERLREEIAGHLGKICAILRRVDRARLPALQAEHPGAPRAPPHE